MKLFIPGPVDLIDEVKEAMKVDMISHRGVESSRLHERITNNLQKIWNTKNQVLISTSSGTGLMEGAIISCVNKRVAIFSMGAFGERFGKVAEGHGVDYDLFKGTWGEPTSVDEVKRAAESGHYDAVCLTQNETSTGIANPLAEFAEVMEDHPEIVWIVDSVSATAGMETRVDDWNIDVIITSAQKCLGLPPGLAFCTFSEKAKERAKMKENRGFYFDLLKLSEKAEEKQQYPTTPALSLYYAADVQLQRIVDKEGIEERIQRHKLLQGHVHQWVKKYGRFFGNEDYLSSTVTAFTLDGLDLGEVQKAMRERGFEIASGYGKLKGKTLRIGHMADCQLETLDEMLKNLTEVVEMMKGGRK